ncbi:MAG: FecR domain-containing protein, partial [Alphaproteobacteria bacterium]
MATGFAQNSATANHDAATPPAGGAIVVEATSGGGPVVVPEGALLLVADFVRAGPDLVLVGPDGTRILVKDYFALADPPALATEGGAAVAPDLVATLAGPLAPGQYAQAAPAAGAAPIGRVTTVEGSVTATRADGTQVTLEADSVVYQGDVLESSPGAAIGLVFTDDTTFSLGESARMVLDELIYDPDTGAGSSTLSVLQGVFVFVSGEIAANNPDAMTVRTPIATIGIRGTTVAGRIEADGEGGTVALLPDPDGSVGSISVTTTTGVYVLSVANQALNMADPLQPPQLVQLSALAMDQTFGAAMRALPQQGAQDFGGRDGSNEG